MKVSVYLSVIPNADRVYVTTKAPTWPKQAGELLYLAEVELPGVNQIDGVIAVQALPLDTPGIRLPAPVEPIESTG